MKFSNAIQATIYKTLKKSLGIEVHAAIPDGAKKPYAVLDSLIVEDWMISPKGWRIEQQVTVLSGQKSSTLLYNLINKVYEEVQEKINISDFQIVNQSISTLKVNADLDGNYYASFVIKLLLTELSPIITKSV